MDKLKIIIAILILALVAESSVLASSYVARPTATSTNQGTQVGTQVVRKSFVFGFDFFNQPISNDTQFSLNDTLPGSWAISIQSQLVPLSSNLRGSEAQVAIAPNYPSENLSIPTIIVQERGDGLLRIEYYAQNWNNSYGLILYNSTYPTWTTGYNVTLRFIAYAPPVQVNPQIAPYPNGNLTITIGNTVVLANYPIAWAGLSDFYIYGLRGSTFTGGVMALTVYEVRSGV